LQIVEELRRPVSRQIALEGTPGLRRIVFVRQLWAGVEDAGTQSIRSRISAARRRARCCGRPTSAKEIPERTPNILIIDNAIVVQIGGVGTNEVSLAASKILKEETRVTQIDCAVGVDVPPRELLSAYGSGVKHRDRSDRK